MSGSGNTRSDRVGSLPIGSAQSSGSGGGGVGGGAVDPCAISQTAPINSPKPAVVSTISVGDVLDVVLTGVAPHRVLEVRVPGGAAAGSLTHRGHLSLVDCIDKGNTYRAEVIQRTGGAVVVRVERV